MSKIDPEKDLNVKNKNTPTSLLAIFSLTSTLSHLHEVVEYEWNLSFMS